MHLIIAKNVFQNCKTISAHGDLMLLPELLVSTDQQATDGIG
jgi:hypothetical protein